MSKFKLPVCSTYISDPAVTHYVESIHSEDGSGIQGWFTSEFDAHRVAKYLKGRNHQRVAVRPFSEYINRSHPFVMMSMGS